jgi:hypothetical protein
MNEMIVDIRGVRMGNLKRLSILAVLLIGSSLCFANQISFQIVQHDDCMDSVSEDSLTIEDSVLNNFFEYGFIVTNSDAAISESAAQDEKLYKIGQGDAFNGFSDYFIQIRLYYERTDETTSENADLCEIGFSITSIKTGKKIADKTMKNIKIDRTKKNNLVKISSDLVDEISKALRAYKA